MKENIVDSRLDIDHLNEVILQKEEFIQTLERIKNDLINTKGRSLVDVQDLISMTELSISKTKIEIEQLKRTIFNKAEKASDPINKYTN